MAQKSSGFSFVLLLYKNIRRLLFIFNMKIFFYTSGKCYRQPNKVSLPESQHLLSSLNVIKSICLLCCSKDVCFYPLYFYYFLLSAFLYSVQDLQCDLRALTQEINKAFKKLRTNKSPLDTEDELYKIALLSHRNH